MSLLFILATLTGSNPLNIRRSRRTVRLVDNALVNKEREKQRVQKVNVPNKVQRPTPNPVKSFQMQYTTRPVKYAMNNSKARKGSKMVPTKKHIVRRAEKLRAQTVQLAKKPLAPTARLVRKLPVGPLTIKKVLVQKDGFETPQRRVNKRLLLPIGKKPVVLNVEIPVRKKVVVVKKKEIPQKGKLSAPFKQELNPEIAPFGQRLNPEIVPFGQKFNLEVAVIFSAPPKEKPIYQPLFTKYKSLLKTCQMVDFEPKSVLGKGGFGTVFRALHKPTGRFYAVKHLTKMGIQKNLKSVAQEESIQHPLQHRNIARYYCSMVAGDGGLLMVQELCPGRNLRDITRKGPPIAKDRLAKIVLQLIEVLAYLHSRHIVHRDFKPHNILIDQHDNVKVVDFGMALIDQNSQITRLDGTLQYLAPEQMIRKPYGRQVDLHYLGVTIFLAYNQKYPFEPVKRWKETKPIGMARINGTLKIPKTPDKDIDEVIRLLMEVDPQKRWSNVYGSHANDIDLWPSKSFLDRPFFKAVRAEEDTQDTEDADSSIDSMMEN